MSRIGKLPIEIPQGVTVNISDSNVVTVKGKLGELTQKVDPDIILKVENNTLTVNRPTEQKRHKAMHGLYRALLANMVEGVSKGYEVKQELVGVGYRVTLTGQILDFSLGFSHPIMLELPAEIKAEVVQEKQKAAVLTMRSFDKQLLGQVAAKIRSFRKPEPYKGKGVKFVNEVLRRKAGKTASSK